MNQCIYKNSKKLLLLASSFYLSLNAMEGEFDVNKFIDENRGSPEVLKELLIDMGRWETPDLKAAQRILNLGLSANAIDKGNIWEGYYGNPGATALTTAAEYGKTAYVQFLLENGAGMETKDPWDGRTALMAASLYGHNNTVKLLLSRGANVNAKNCSNVTALMWAAGHAKIETVQLLLNAGADITMQDENGKTALDEALHATPNFSQSREQFDEIVRLLEDALSRSKSNVD